MNIFVDFFGTIMDRDCDTEDLKKNWCNKISFLLNFSYSSSAIYHVRKTSESMLYKEKEYKYSELLEEIYSRLNIAEKINIQQEAFADECFKIEVDIEKKHQIVNKRTLNKIKLLKKEGNKCFIVSDFYMGRECIQSFLRDKGIADLFDGIYVSCDYGKSKAKNGMLYEIVMDILGVDSKSCIMYGDSLRADFIMAKKKGLNTYRIIPNKSNECSVDVKRILKESISEMNGVHSLANYVYILYIFIDKLYKHCIRNHISRLYFFSREGLYLKKLFDKYVDSIKREFGIEGVESVYLYVSRKATYAASLKKINEEKFESLFKLYPDQSIRGFLENIGFNLSMINTIIDILPIDADRKILGFDKSLEFDKLKNIELFRKLYSENVAANKTLLKDYLCDNGIGNELHVVDVGWRGSIQDNIYNCYEGNIKICGYYIGVFGNVINSSKNKKYGLIFTDSPCKSDNFDVYKYNYHLWENILMASHPALKGYSSGEDGSVIPVFESFDSELKNFNVIKDVQEVIYNVFCNIIATDLVWGGLRKRFYKDLTSLYLEGLQRGVNATTSRGISYLNKNHLENWGYNSEWGKMFGEKLKGLYDYSVYDIANKMKDKELIVAVLNQKKFYGVSSLIMRNEYRRLRRKYLKG